MDSQPEQHRAAHQAIAEIAADLGVPFTLRALADACESAARAQTGLEAQQMTETARFLRQLSSLGED